MKREAKMSEINETFTERVDVTTTPDGTRIGQMDMGVRAGDHLAQQIADLEADKLALLDRVAEQEGENADLYELGDRWLHLRTTRTGAAALRLDGVARGRDPIAAMIAPPPRGKETGTSRALLGRVGG